MMKYTLIALALLLSACVTTQTQDTLGKHMGRNDCEGAVKYISAQKKAYGTNMRLNFLLDSAMINLQCGNYDKSNAYFHKADDLAEKLWTKSISSEAAAYVTNDYLIPYAGEDFEKAGINMFSAINYVLQGNMEEALVECRRLDSVLTLYNDKYDEKNVYKEDAFGRYLSGMIYEAEGEFDDAYIDYFKAYKTYKDYEKNYKTSAPNSLIEDLLRMAEATGRRSEIISDFAELGGKAKGGHKTTKNLGKIVLIHLNGKAPKKISESFTVTSNEGPISIAFPRYLVQGPSCSESRMVVTSASSSVEAKSELVQDINKIAVKNLEDRKGRVIVKAIARAVVKQVVADNVIDDARLKAIFNVFNTVILEKADTRTWGTLPGEIYISRVFVEPGEHSISASSCGNNKFLKKVSIKSGETRFVLLDTIY